MKKFKRGNETTVEQVCLRNLGVSSTDEINAWFKKSYAGLYRIDGIDEAIDLLDSRRWDLVRVIGDYDVDGTTATAQMRLVLSSLGYPVKDRIPHRFTEGFGLNKTIVEEIPERDNVLLITVDNGIAAVDAVELAKQKGFYVVVIDHHLPVTVGGVPFLPEADVIIDPHAVSGSADYSEYCGAGLAWRFLSRLLDRKAAGMQEKAAKKLGALKVLLGPLAMMGTIADVVELREENYVIARNGLAKLDKRCATPGVMALHDKLYVVHPTAGDIGFKSGPCINANGRLFDDGAERSVDLLSCTSWQLAGKLADQAITNNNTRKQQVDAACALAEQVIAAHGYENDLPMVVYLKGVNEGILGIIAGKLTEKYGTVACVFTDAAGGVLKGSGRSIDGVHLEKMLEKLEELFVKFGGHAGAAGMSILPENLEAFRMKANAYAKACGFQHEVKSELAYDLEIRADQVVEYLDETGKFGPFGQGNAPVMFKVTGFRLNEMSPRSKKAFVGKNGVKLSCDHCQAIGFGMADRMKACSANVLTLYGTLSYNYFRGNAIPQIEYVDFEEEPEPEREETDLMKALRAQAIRR